MPVRVKICGITNREDAESAVNAGADALGFILYEKSRRYIPVEEAIRIVEGLPPFVQTVAVTVNAVKEFTNLGWRKQLKNFNVAQLHGEETPHHVKAVSKYLPVIKVFPADAELLLLTPQDQTPGQVIGTIEKLKFVKAQVDQELGHEATLEEVAAETNLPIEQLHEVFRLDQNLKAAGVQRPGDYEAHVAAFMLDTPAAERGGTGRVFDWSLAVEFMRRTPRPLVLSGGLNPENVAKAIGTVHPYAVDVASGVEVSPGRKDHAKLRDFIQICKSC